MHYYTASQFYYVCRCDLLLPSDREAWSVGLSHKEPCIRWGRDPPWEGTNLGDRGAHCKI